MDAIELPDVVTAEDEAAALQRGLDLLRRPTKSGFQDVFPSASKINPWQAKPYVRPHVQRSLGLFATPEEAAIQVLLWIIGRRPTPPSPDGSRNKRGEGKKKRDRRKVPGHASLFAMPCCFQPLTTDSRACVGFHSTGIDLGTRAPRARKELIPGAPSPPAAALVAETEQPAPVPVLEQATHGLSGPEVACWLA